MCFNKNIIPFAACLIYVATLTLSCTSNPFSNDQEIKEAKLSGQVELSDGLSPDSVYVWLEGINLGAYTDNNGKFSISLPPPEAQGYGKGFNGELNLYFYVANYGLGSSVVVFANGKLDQVQQDIDEDGSLIEVKTLSPLLHIRTSTLLQSLNFGVQDTFPMKVIVEFETFYKTLVVESLREDLPWPQRGFFRTGIIFKSLDNPSQNTIFVDSPKCFLYHDALLKNSKQTWEYDFELNKDEILPGKYSVFPYLLIHQRNVPPELIESISPGVEDFGMDYLKLPMKRTDGLFEVMSDN